MTSLTHTQAVDYLRHTPQTVTLRFLRHDDWESSEATSVLSTPRNKVCFEVNTAVILYLDNSVAESCHDVVL